jgi:hypothetical protein
MTQKLIVFFLLISALCTSCASLHVFNATNSPCLTGAKDGNANLYVGTDHAEAQASYSPIKHLGILANSYFVFSKIEGANSWGTSFGEGAVGYYGSFQRNNPEPHFFFDIYGGYGSGQRKFDGAGSTGPSGSYDNYLISSSYNKSFVQGSIYFTKDRQQIALGFQESNLYFNSLFCCKNVEDRYTLPPPYPTYSNHHFNVLCSNVTLTYKVGLFWKLSLIAQVAYNNNNFVDSPLILPQPSNHPPSNLRFDTTPLRANVGFQIRF